MPYYARRRRTMRKRSVRSTRTPLSARRIFGYTSARSQANQIYALKKSINKINRRFKPEVYTHHNQVISKEFTNSTFSDSYWYGYYEWPASGTGDENKRGDKIWCKNMQLNFTFEYMNNSNTGYHDSDSSGCPVRVIVLKTKQVCSPSDIPTLNDILLYSSNSGSDYTQRAVSPYVHGITDKYKILCSKVFYMTTAKNQKIMRLFLQPGLIQWESGSIANHVFIYVAPCGLHSDADFTEKIQMTLSKKIAYVDY